MDVVDFIDVPDLFLDAPLVWDASTQVSDRLCTDLCERCDVLIDQQGAPFTGATEPPSRTNPSGCCSRGN